LISCGAFGADGARERPEFGFLGGDVRTPGLDLFTGLAVVGRAGSAGLAVWLAWVAWVAWVALFALFALDFAALEFAAEVLAEVLPEFLAVTAGLDPAEALDSLFKNSIIGSTAGCPLEVFGVFGERDEPDDVRDPFVF